MAESLPRDRRREEEDVRCETDHARSRRKPEIVPEEYRGLSRVREIRRLHVRGPLFSEVAGGNRERDDRKGCKVERGGRDMGLSLASLTVIVLMLVSSVESVSMVQSNYSMQTHRGTAFVVGALPAAGPGGIADWFSCDLGTGVCTSLTEGSGYGPAVGVWYGGIDCPSSTTCFVAEGPSVMEAGGWPDAVGDWFTCDTATGVCTSLTSGTGLGTDPWGIDCPSSTTCYIVDRTAGSSFSGDWFRCDTRSRVCISLTGGVGFGVDPWGIDCPSSTTCYIAGGAAGAGGGWMGEWYSCDTETGACISLTDGKGFGLYASGIDCPSSNTCFITGIAADSIGDWFSCDTATGICTSLTTGNGFGRQPVGIDCPTSATCFIVDTHAAHHELGDWFSCDTTTGDCTSLTRGNGLMLDGIVPLHPVDLDVKLEEVSGKGSLEIMACSDANQDGRCQPDEGLEGWVFDIAKVVSPPKLSDYFRVEVTPADGRILLSSLDTGEYLVSQWTKPEWECPSNSGDEPYDGVVTRKVIVESGQTASIIFPNRMPSDPSASTPVGDLPYTIRIWRTKSSKLEVIDFRHYVKGVLPPEWGENLAPEALNAGAVAVKMYAWYHVIVPKHNADRAHLWDDSGTDQVYDETYQYNNDPKNKELTNSAVDQTWTTAMIDRGSKGHRYGHRYYAEYLNGVGNVGADILNIRDGPGLEYSIKGTASLGEELIVLSNGRRRADGYYWFLIKTGGISEWNPSNYVVGWVAGTLVKYGIHPIDEYTLRMTQYGSEYWARQEKNYRWILSYFYPDAEFLRATEPNARFSIGDRVQVTAPTGWCVRREAWLGDRSCSWQDTESDAQWLAPHGRTGTIVSVPAAIEEQFIVGKVGPPPNQPQSSHARPDLRQSAYAWWYVVWDERDEEGKPYEGWSADDGLAIVPIGIAFAAKSPVDISITDPDGFLITKQLNEVPGATYLEIDLNGDGDPDDYVTIADRKRGDYLISVTPQPDAIATDTYTLEIRADGTTVILAEDIPIGDIPRTPYIVRSTDEEVIPIIPGTVDFEPDTLNLKSKGLWATVYIQFPVGHGYDVSMIDLASVWLNGEVHAEAQPVKLGDRDGDGVLDLMVKFNLATVRTILRVGDEVEVTISGKLVDGRLFEGKDTIRVIRPP